MDEDVEFAIDLVRLDNARDALASSKEFVKLWNMMRVVTAIMLCTTVLLAAHILGVM